MPTTIEHVQEQAARIREAFANMPYMGGAVDPRTLVTSGEGSAAEEAVALMRSTAIHLERLVKILGAVSERHAAEGETLREYRHAVHGAAQLQRLIDEAKT